METSFLSHVDTRSVLDEVQNEVNKVRQMKNEVESLGTEVKKLLQSRHDQSVVSIYQNKCFQNLEAQLDALKEELQAECDLRASLENELKNALEDLKFYKNANKLHAEERLTEMRQQYELAPTQNGVDQRQSGKNHDQAGDVQENEVERNRLNRTESSVVMRLDYEVTSLYFV
ncbi:hypothetical protein FBUS_06837 [Fasciolopsis buskii]|uniref:Uncharacterized protein n=1 Tax=Fasciolopsis buskii TaxID=27845 RepID=A0A8E0RZL9_9TREM|nr:hypothetical protein FBUS_06837 [Fasciolopsis buski]